MDLPQGELAVAAQQRHGDAPKRISPEGPRVGRDRWEGRLVGARRAANPVPGDGRPEELVEQQRLFDEGPAPERPVDGLGIEGVEAIHNGLALDVDELAGS